MTNPIQLLLLLLLLLMCLLFPPDQAEKLVLHPEIHPTASCCCSCCCCCCSCSCRAGPFVLLRLFPHVLFFHLHHRAGPIVPINQCQVTSFPWVERAHRRPATDTSTTKLHHLRLGLQLLLYRRRMRRGCAWSLGRGLRLLLLLLLGSNSSDTSTTILSLLLLLSSTTKLKLSMLLLLSSTTKLSLLLRLLLLSSTIILSLLLLSSTTESPPPAIALKSTANAESMRVHRRRCCCRHDRRQLPLLQRLGLAVSAGSTDDFLHL